MSLALKFKESIRLNSVNLQSERLKLRTVSECDAVSICRHGTFAIAAYWIGWEPSESLEATRRLVRQMVTDTIDGNALHLILETVHGDFVGSCGIDKTDFEDYEVYVWIKSTAQRQGFGAEALGKILQWTAENSSLPYLVYSVTEGNEASQCLLSKFDATAFRRWTAEKRGTKRIVADHRLWLRTPEKKIRRAGQQFQHFSSGAFEIS